MRAPAAPAAAGWLVRRGRELADIPRAARAALAGGAGASAATVPPRALRARTGAPGAHDWVEGGRRGARELEAALALARSVVAADELEAAPAGRFDAYRDILDFGCGSARVLPHVAVRAPHATCTGCDVDAAAIGWAAQHHAALRFAVSGYEPPLPFADGAFDLVYSISVLSHLDEALQDRWLAELRRVLRLAGGTALLSVHGPHAFEEFRAGRVRTGWCPPGAFDRPALGDGEFVFVPYTRSRWNRADMPGIGGGYGLAFHGPGYVRERWGRFFDVAAVVPRALTAWQDVAVLHAATAGATSRSTRTAGIS
jgi:SAM-dependent methyltransferase